MSVRRVVVRSVWSLLVLAAMSGCVRSPDSASRDSIRLLLNGLAGGQHAGFVYARALGYYADEGLNVTILEGHGSADTVRRVASGDADFGFADALSISHAAGSVSVVSTIFQFSQLAILSLQSQPVATTAALHGKRIGSTPGTVSRALFNMVLSANGLNDVAVLDIGAEDLVPALRSGRVDGIVGSRDFEALQLRGQGENVVGLSFVSAGAGVVGLSVVANRDLLGRSPDLVRRFMRATLRGWDAARADPSAASRAVVGQFLAGYEDEVDAQLQADLPLLCDGGTELLGLPADSSWSETLRSFVGAGLLASAPDPSTFINRDFVPADAPRCPAS